MGEWSQARMVALIERLESVFGEPSPPPISEPLDELVACILSQHTTDATSIPAFESLRSKFPTWADAEAAGVTAIAEAIKAAGLANQKAKSILRCLVATRETFGSHTLADLHGWDSNRARRFLEGLSGVGPKTAAIVLCFAMGRDVVPVDTHVYRVAVRLGMVPQVGEAKAHPLLDALCPPGYAYRLHKAFIRLGRESCKALRPRCASCHVLKMCPCGPAMVAVSRMMKSDASETDLQDRSSAEVRRHLNEFVENIRIAYVRGGHQASEALQALDRVKHLAARFLRHSKGRMRYALEAIPSHWEAERKRSPNLYPQVVHLREDRERLGQALGAGRHLGLMWLEKLPDVEGTLETLLKGEDALHRFSTVIASAPSLVPTLAEDPATSAAILDGSIDGFDVEPTYAHDASPNRLALGIRADVAAVAARWVLNPSRDLSADLARYFDQVLRYLCGRLCVSIDLVALGSFGTCDMTLGSDLDLAALMAGPESRGPAEIAALAGFVENLRLHGAPIKLDFGVDSLLRGAPATAVIRSYDGMKQYELESMDFAERFGLGNARMVWGNSEADVILQRAAYAVPLTPERLREIVAAKRRYEAEHVQPKHRRRDVMRGQGGLTDIEWFVHLHELRFPTATYAGSTVDFDKRIANIASARLINSVERDELIEARRHLKEVRHRLILLGLSRDVVPENPDKLARLAHDFGYADGNDFLSYHERVTETVRAIYEEGLERLKA